MRVAVLADVHGNLHALRAVLDDVDKQSPDLTVNLGDCLSGPLEAGATADLLIARGFPTICGNHDRHLRSTPEHALGRSDRAAAAQLTGAHREWLRSFPASMSIGDDLFLCHGTPSNDNEYLLEEIDGGRLVLASRTRLLERTNELAASARVVVCGHSHVPRAVRLGDRLLVNPGSVGLPAYYSDDPSPHVGENGSPYARYAILERHRGTWRVDFVAVEYDWSSAAATATVAGFDDWASCLSSGYGPAH